MSHPIFQNALANSTSDQWKKLNKFIQQIEQQYFKNSQNPYGYTFAMKNRTPEAGSFQSVAFQQTEDQRVQEEAKKLDAKIAELEMKAKDSKKGLFSGIYNLFSKKDNKLEKELNELKAVRKAALEDDGKIDANELRLIKKELGEADESLQTYKKGKKGVADIASTVVSIGVGIAVGAALAPFTGGASLLVTAACIAGTAAAGGVAKVASKELMLGDEYEALGKEGLKDGLIAAAYSATGGVTSAVTKGASLGVKIGVGAVGDVGITLATDENARKELAEGNFTRLAIVAGSGAVFRGGMSKLSSAKVSGSLVHAKEFATSTSGKIVLTSGNYVGKRAVMGALPA
ncbi:MAG: hypothetical protein AB1782_02815 [Cyanobacteriota bacterium]